LSENTNVSKTFAPLNCLPIILKALMKRLVSSYPMFSHLQQQKQQTNMATRITPAITEMVMMRVWKFTVIHTTQNWRDHSCPQLVLQNRQYMQKVKLPLTHFKRVQSNKVTIKNVIKLKLLWTMD